MRFKIPFLCTLILAMLSFCSFADSVKQIDQDIGWSKSIVKITDSDQSNFQIGVAAFESPAAWVHQESVKDIYKKPKSNNPCAPCNCRIDHNFPFRHSGNVGPPATNRLE